MLFWGVGAGGGLGSVVGRCGRGAYFKVFRKSQKTFDRFQVSTRLYASRKQSPSGASLYAVTDVYPRPLLCLPDNNVAKYRGIKIWHVSTNPDSWDDPNLIDFYSNLRPIIFSSISAVGKGFDTQFGLCMPVSGRPIIVIYWSDDDQSLQLFVRLHEESEAPINWVLRNRLLLLL